MVKPGICMNLVAIAIQLVFINTFGRLVFDLGTFPDWAVNEVLPNTTTTGVYADLVDVV